MYTELTKTQKYDEEKAKDTAKESQKEFQIPAKWEWLPCNYEFKRENNGVETHWSLAPTIQLAGCDPKIPPKADILISLERSFMYSDELGWNWHKSWNLPNITITIKITDQKTNEAILPPANLKGQLLAVKVLSNKAELFKLYDLGLKGSYVQDLSEGQTIFSGIKFSSTSYNNDGLKFHLIVLVYVQEESNTKDCPKILYSRISPPIFVDSRKSARDSNIIRNKKIVYKYFDPFFPESFEKTFVKRNTKQSDAKEEIIENSLEGLAQYFTAPNIRNKVKHPIFLAVKFSRCVKLFYNTNLIKSTKENDEINEEDLIKTMQKIFIESYEKNKLKNDNNSNNKCFYNKSFILLIEEPNNIDSFQLNKKISDYLDPIQNEVLHVIFNSNITPSNFKEINHEKLARAYIKIYPNLIYHKNTSTISNLKYNEESRGKISGKPNEDLKDFENDLSDDDNNDNIDKDLDSDSDEPLLKKKMRTNNDSSLIHSLTSRTRSINQDEKESLQIKEEPNEKQVFKPNSFNPPVIDNDPTNGLAVSKPINIQNNSIISNCEVESSSKNDPIDNQLPHNMTNCNTDINLNNHKSINSLFGDNSIRKIPVMSPKNIIPNNTNVEQLQNSMQTMKPSIMPSLSNLFPRSSNISFNANLPSNNPEMQIDQSNNLSSIQQAIPNTKSNDISYNLLIAFQQEQMKNQVLMNYFIQSMNQNAIDNANKIDLLKLAGMGISNNASNMFGGNILNQNIINNLGNGSLGSLGINPVSQNGISQNLLSKLNFKAHNQSTKNEENNESIKIDTSSTILNTHNQNSKLPNFLMSNSNSTNLLPTAPKTMNQMNLLLMNNGLMNQNLASQTHFNPIFSSLSNQTTPFTSNQLKLMLSGGNNKIGDNLINSTSYMGNSSSHHQQ